MNLRTGAFVGLLCIGLASAQLNYQPEFLSAGQGFRSASQYRSKSISKRQAPGGDGTDVIPHDQKKQTTFWWVAPDSPFKATKIGGGVQTPPGAGEDGAAGGAAGGVAGVAGIAGAAGAAGQAGGVATAGQAGAFGATRTSQSSFQATASRTFGAAGGQAGQGPPPQPGQFGAGGTATSVQATASRTVGTQTGAAVGQGQAVGGIGGFGTTISRTSTATTRTSGVQGQAGAFGQTTNTQGVGTNTVAGGTRTNTFTATNQVSSQGVIPPGPPGQPGQPGQPAVTGGVRTTSTFRKTTATTTTGVAPIPAPAPPPPVYTNTNTATTISRNTNTATTITNTQQQQPPPPGTFQTNTNTATTSTFGAATRTDVTGTRTDQGPPPISPTSGIGGSSVTRTQENTGAGISTHTITSGVNLQPFFKKTTVTSHGYDYPVPTTVPCYEPNKVCTPNEYCVNGLVQESQLNLFNTNNQNCNSATEQCCKILPAPPPTQCPDNTYVCVSPDLCNNGLLNFDAQNAISPQPSGQCFSPEVCCKTQSLISESTVLTNEGYVDTNEVPSPAQDTPSFIRPTPPPRPIQPRPNPPPVGGTAPPPLPPVGCSAAMNCTEREFCSSTGVISKTPVVLTPEQELFRVPVTECRNPEKGFTGVCCRDPDYVDPWPVGMLGLYNPEILPFDDGSYKPNGNNGNGVQSGNSISQTQRNEAILASPSRVTAAQNYGPNQITSASQTQYTQSKAQYDRGVTASASTTSTTALQRQQTQTTSSTAGSSGTKRFTAGGLQFVHSGNTRFKPFQKQNGGQCAPRNYNTQPRGAGPWDTGFGEFPWQAMVILESNKTLLCGGAIISETTVVTAANCVYGLNPRDVMIKGGEWRLGVDAEPKTFQIVRVKNVIYHPAYQPTTLNYDVAMLVLEDRLRFDTHIGQLCLDENDVVPSASYENCVTTGWGREVLKVHIGNALMRQMPISLLSEAESQRELQNNGFTPESHICGRPAADACDVDIGSALACADTSGTYYLKGVYSSDNGCGRPDQIVSFSNIDVQWIRQALKNPNQFITPVPNYQTAANSPVASTVQQPSTLGPNYGKAYLPPY
ncbi:mucin-5AC isoform X2 [Aedes aegypti]|uniref:Uncharacterized protein n=2 Tax=Aedes aegypti TaxID=7159 RepID=A0A1S4G7R1_AEDAE|nr:mucin-5AC isoform X2 [Aedes aegypti]